MGSRLRQIRRHCLNLTQLIVESLADRRRRLSRLFRHGFQAGLHVLAKGVEIHSSLLRLLPHAARGVVELTSDLFKLTAHLRDHRVEVTLEVADRARGMRLRLVAEFLDLAERLLNLATRVVAERRGELLRAFLCVGEGALHETGIVLHHAVEFLRLGVHRVEQRDDGLMAALKD